MNDIFLNPLVALAVVISICLASLYCAAVGLWTFSKLPQHREVARAVSLMIVLSSLLAIFSGVVTHVQGTAKGPIQLSQVVDLLNILINVLVLRLFLRPCYLEDQPDGSWKECHELS
jgi:hypothetical protein